MLGITILPEYIQSEGPEALLDNLLKRMPLTAVSTSPYVMEECPPEQGGEREPPADSDKGLARLLDRPLWGKREVWVNATPSFEPNLDLYRGLRYQPLAPTGLTRREGPVIDRFIEAAHERGIKVYFQIQAAIPPGYRVQFGGPVEEDMPRLPDGSITSRRLDKNGSLASPHILAYGEALIRDLLGRYPDINGIRCDWPEYPPYFLETVFLDFGDHAKALAEEKGFDFERMRQNVGALYKQLTEQLDDQLLQTYLESPDSILEQWSHCQEWLEFKTVLVSNLLARFRKAIDEAGGPNKELFPSAFPPPWNRLSGFDYTQVSKVANAISCKYYTMHWPMMLRNYSDSLTGKNTGLSKSLLAACLAKGFDAVSPVPTSSEEFHYPEPTERHPVDLESLTRRQQEVESYVQDTPIWPIAHSYGPVEDFKQRAAAVLSVSKNRLWINRYAYLNDKKLDALGELFGDS
ncbi:MAG: hypothetical protein O7C75_16070 [Verrucomicrobia bacterium]|nr:hypothetical protein [Verrucomicrobiota bacterium]